MRVLYVLRESTISFNFYLNFKHTHMFVGLLST